MYGKYRAPSWDNLEPFDEQAFDVIIRGLISIQQTWPYCNPYFKSSLSCTDLNEIPLLADRWESQRSNKATFEGFNDAA
jgi:hypothetical protein